MTPTVFLETLTTVVEGLDKNKVRAIIGDSNNNNRVLTVNQVIRFLTTRRNTEAKTLGFYLLEVYNATRHAVANSRSAFGLARRDSIDINEFIYFLTEANVSVNNSVRAALKRAA